MKKRIIIMSMLIFIFGQSIAYATLSGSSHDLSALTGGKMCEVCHTPHNADTTLDAPLWDHENTAATFDVYTSHTISTTPGQPGDVSKLCLSCHDGTVAVDSFAGQTGSTMIDASAEIGTNLQDDHPIGILWDHIDPGVCAGCHVSDPEVKFFDGYVECASCHDAHNNADEYKMLRVSLDNAELCLRCHGK